MEAVGASQSPPPAAAATSAVLGDDDLLCEILVRVAFPTSLVRSALVCKRWLCLSSDPVFLRRFRDLHPPSILGFYVDTRGTKSPRFVPMRQPPELAAVVRRANFDLGHGNFDFVSVDCWNGLLLFTSYIRLEPTITTVRFPLCPARYTTILPPTPDTSITYYEEQILPNPNGGEDSLQFFFLGLGSKGRLTTADVYVLQDGIWGIYSSVVSEISLPIGILLLPGGLSSLIRERKMYYLASVVMGEIDRLFVLDLVSSSLSLVKLPEEVLSGRLSLADDSGVHLISLKDLQIRIWLHRMDCNGVASWFLVNTICLREIFANHMIPLPSHMFEDVDDSILEVHAAGFNSEFVFIQLDNALYFFDIKRKVANKVYELTQEDKYLFRVSPFVMVWPPKFPMLIAEGRAVNE